MNEEREVVLLFCVGENATDVFVSQDGDEIDQVRIEPNRDLLEKFLPAIDTLLSKHGFSSRDVADIRVESELPDGYSSRRIAETIANVWRFARGY